MTVQPDNPVEFLQGRLAEMVPSPQSPPGVEEPVEDSDAQKIERLKEEVSRLRGENSRLRWSFAVKHKVKDHIPAFVAVNWNLAGVNENPFEFAAGGNEGDFSRVTKFIAAVDALIASVLRETHDDYEDYEPEEESPLVSLVRSMQAQDMMAGLMHIAAR